MSGFVPSAPNPDDSAGVPVPPPSAMGVPTPPGAPTPGGAIPPGQQPGLAPQPFGAGGDGWGGAATPPGGGDEGGGRKVSPLVIVILAILGVALVGFGAYSFFGNSSEPGPSPTPSPTQTIPVNPSVKPIPSVVGFTIEEATLSLQNAGFVVGLVTDQPDSVQEGTVLSQDPPSGVEVAEGTPISLVVATPSTPGVPDVEGLSKTDATNTLIEDGFEIGKVTKKDSGQAKGTVLKQTPTAGKKADPGTKVNLVVSTGKVAVPDVVGRKEARAIADLENAGFKVKTEDARNGDVGRVKGQNPKAGTMKEKGTTVVISVVPRAL